MFPGRRLGSAATRFLRYLLPISLIAATLVAGQGLLVVLGRTGAPAVSEDPVSLNLGAAGVAPSNPLATVPPAKVPSPKVSLEKPSSSHAATRSRPAPPPVTSPVAVFNAGHVRGLAGRAATFLRAHGVVVTTVDNLSSATPLSARTVFYPPGKVGQARTLAALTDTTSVQPAPAWLGGKGKLVLVVTDTSTTSASGPLGGS